MVDDAPPPAAHIAILPSPGFGHLIPMAEFAKRLVHHHHNITATFLIPTKTPPSSAYLQVLNSLPDSIDHIILPPVDFSDLSPLPKFHTLFSLTIHRSLPSIRTTLASIQTSRKLVAIVVDLFGTDAFDPAIELGISPYIFFPTAASGLSLLLHLPQLHHSVTCEYRHLTDSIRIPGFPVPVNGSDLPDPLLDRTDEGYNWMLHQAKRFSMAHGIMVNSFMEFEPHAINYLQTIEPEKLSIYPIGPMVQTDNEMDALGSEIINWLDRQPINSVLFVSFGSGGTLSFDQLAELAHGLESSQQRFLWVIRCPNQIHNNNFFSVQNQNDPLIYLPKGFLDRTKERGLVIPNWAPQVQILNHGSTGGFMSHCGWNSTLESVMHGVPIIAWPLYAEQKLTTVVLTEDMKVALRLKRVGEKVIDRVEIATVIKMLMEGEEGKKVTSKMKELKIAAACAIGKDGAANKAIGELAKKWTNMIVKQ